MSLTKRRSPASTKKKARNFSRVKVAPLRFPLFAPDRMSVALVATDNIILAGTAVAGTVNAVSLNSAYDPYVGVGGGKCSGFDQWKELYQNYIVRSSEHTVKFILNDSDVSDNSMVVGIVPTSSSLTYPTSVLEYADWLIETPRAQYARFTNFVEGTPLQVASFKGQYNIAQIEGITGPLDYYQYGAPVTADPPAQPQLNLVVGLDNAVSTWSVSVNVASKYFVEFYNVAGAHNAE